MNHFLRLTPDQWDKVVYILALVILAFLLSYKGF